MSIALPEFTLNNEKMYPAMDVYRDGKSCAIKIMSDEGPFMTLSVALEKPAGEWKFWAKTWSENQPYIQPILDQCKWFKAVENNELNADWGVTATMMQIDPKVLSKEMATEISKLMRWKDPAAKAQSTPSM